LNVKLSVADKNEKMFIDGLFSDIEVRADGRTLKAHRSFLIQSPVFKEMIEKGKISQNNIVDVKDFSFDVMKEMLRFLYSNRLENLDAHAIDLIMCAYSYELPDLEETCSKWLETNVNIVNFASCIIVADLLNIEPLKRAALKFIIE
jgi:speckle-type POZ protein